MEDKQVKKINRYLEDLIEGRDDLFQSIETLIDYVSLQVQALSNCQTSLLQNEALLKYLTKSLGLFTELHHTVLVFSENEPLPDILKNVQMNEKKQSKSRDLSKIPSTSDFKPVLTNLQVLNNSSIKDINKVTSDTHVQVKLQEIPVDVDDIPSNNYKSPPSSVSMIGESKEKTDFTSLIQEHHEQNIHVSPAFSSHNSDIFSNVSSTTYQSPLTKFQSLIEIPKQDDVPDLKQIKENLKFFSRKMGFGSSENDVNCLTTSQYRGSVNEIQKESSNKDGEVVNNEENDTITSTDSQSMSGATGTSTNSKNVSEKINKSPENAARVLDKDDMELTSEDTGTSTDSKKVSGEINKSTENMTTVLKNEDEPSNATNMQKPSEDLIEFASSSSTNPECCDKVSKWLRNNLPEQGSMGTGALKNVVNSQPNSAIEKLLNVKRHDRNEEAQDQARKNMPDLRLIPAEPPAVIKNDLSSGSSSTKKKTNNKKKKLKNLGGENLIYEIKPMEPPQVGALCAFSHIVSPSEFYLQMLEGTYTKHLDDIAEKLDRIFSTTEIIFSSKQQARNTLGKYCCGYIFGEKNGWYRLQILDWELDSSLAEVEVKSIDYGFKYRTSYQYLREMPRDLAEIPMLAIQCHFPLLYAPGSTYSNRSTEWSETAISCFMDAVNFHCDNYSDLKIYEIILAILEGESLAVDLVQFSEPEADSLRNGLIDFGVAVEIRDDYGENPELGEFLEDLGDLEQADNLNELVLGYDARDEARICKFTRKNGTCYKGKNCKLEHIIVKDGYTTDKVTSFHDALNSPKLPNKGETVPVLVTAYIDSCTYLAQIVRNSKETCLFLRDKFGNERPYTFMDKDLSDLIDAMNHPKKVSQYEKFKIFPAEGEIVLAYYSLYKKWLRVVVNEVEYDNSGSPMNIQVYAVDFGESFVVKLRDLRVMVEEFMNLPFQAVQIYLDNYQHKVGCDSEKAKLFFEQHILHKNFLMVNQSHQVPLKVSLTTCKGRDIGPTLIQKGLAEKRSMDVFTAEHSPLDLQ